MKKWLKYEELKKKYVRIFHRKEIRVEMNKELLKCDERFNFDKWLGELIECRLKKLEKEDKYNLEKITIIFK